MDENKKKFIPSTLLTEKSKYAPAITEQQAQAYAQRIDALANPTRLLLLNILAHNKGPVEKGLVHVAVLADAFNLGQPTISRHLQILREAGFIDCWMVGLSAHYYINEDALPNLFDVMLAVFETGEANANVDDSKET